jgi:hypothetical protein
MDDMRQLVKHGIDHLLDGDELVSVAGVSESKEDFLTGVYIQPY